MEKIILRTATVQDIPSLWNIALAMGAAKIDGYFDHALDHQSEGIRKVLIASVDEVDVGYGMLAWQPKYVFFQRLDIPEIQDLNVISNYRRCGIASQMIQLFEDLAKDAGKEHIGIGVGMDASYGAAQRLYVHRGYVPDGNGLTYDRQTIHRGDIRAVDDDMSLMLVKKLV
ncbi:MAG: GNAT family N-acetyltransferase [Bdellovibrionales bacterium]